MLRCLRPEESQPGVSVQFENAVTFAGGSGVADLRIGDLNADGRADIALASSAGASVLFNQISNTNVDAGSFVAVQDFNSAGEASPVC